MDDAEQEEIEIEDNEANGEDFDDSHNDELGEEANDDVWGDGGATDRDGDVDKDEDFVDKL
ncbi:hypothetical protein FRC06_001244, partial [Ceratobasidium sp. 370]